MYATSLIKVATLFSILHLTGTQNLETRKNKAPSRYPVQVHNMYKDRLLRKGPKISGDWSSWSSWTPCSRSCGGGIMQQTRRCVNRPADPRFIRRQRRRRQNVGATNGCVGLYKRIRLCNTQDCPNSRDFRYEQCAAFNNRPFKGRTYYWEPYLKVNDECALNCRAMGMNFYATLNKSVIDGTPCIYPMTSVGKMAPKGTKGVCIEGYCKSVNSFGVIGSIDNENQEKCAQCLKGSCRGINGIYTRPDLPTGYSLITQIPQGACNILVQQIKHTRNYLALKHTNGSYIVNGDWKFSSSKTFVEPDGNKFNYIKQDGNLLETITSTGPLANSVDIMVVNFQANYGIKYAYSIPSSPDERNPIIAPPFIQRPTIEPYIIQTRRLDFNSSLILKDEAKSPHNPHRRNRMRRKYFQWQINGLSPCSRSCGGGTQTYMKTCVRLINPHKPVQVPEKRCAYAEPPVTPTRKCNIESCPPNWEGYWSECSTTCGDGVQQYHYQCKQDTSGGSIILNDPLCLQSKPISRSRVCTNSPCESNNVRENELLENPETRIRKDEWTTESWSECSVSCGTGYRTRKVNCPSGLCPTDVRPKHAEYCELPSCSINPLSSTFSNDSSSFKSSWLTSEWSQCSEPCGTGTQTRLTLCLQNDCNPSTKPELSKVCSSDKLCIGQWFTGPWGSCSDSCSGPAKQIRDIFCIVKIKGFPTITNEMTCAIQSKPISEQACDGTCSAQWFSSDWGTCDGTCPVGVQRRNVKCLEVDGKGSDSCVGDDAPIGKRTCACENRGRNKPVHDEPVDRSCVDKSRRCKLAVQARLCQYSYYTKQCCESCRKALLE